MQPKMHRNFDGSFIASESGQGSWRLAPPTASEQPVEIFVRGADAQAASAFGVGNAGAAPLTELSIEWQSDGGALLSMLRAGEVGSVRAASAIVHEPLPALYKGLPLQEFDARAQAFWRRVFFLVRIPGGRRILGFLARRNRKA